MSADPKDNPDFPCGKYNVVTWTPGQDTNEDPSYKGTLNIYKLGNSYQGKYDMYLFDGTPFDPDGGLCANYDGDTKKLTGAFTGYPKDKPMFWGSIDMKWDGKKFTGPFGIYSAPVDGYEELIYVSAP